VCVSVTSRPSAERILKAEPSLIVIMMRFIVTRSEAKYF